MLCCPVVLSMAGMFLYLIKTFIFDLRRSSNRDKRGVISIIILMTHIVDRFPLFPLCKRMLFGPAHGFTSS